MRLLVIRASAMGDVALVTPVLKGLLEKYNDVEIILLTRSLFKPFFMESERLKIFSPDFKDRHKGFAGIFRLYKDIRSSYKIDYVIDIHDVLRSKILRSFFRAGGTPVSAIDKGRKEKRDLITGKKKAQLKHSVQRYCDTFKKAGFIIEPFPGPSIEVKSANNNVKEILGSFRQINIGIAPYALHNLKMWPEENMLKLMMMISEKYSPAFFMFGARDEAVKLEKICEKVPGTINLAGRLDLDSELFVMSKLDFVIAMDSSNMHMAALTGTRVISIWGGTDPFGGFGAWMQPDNQSIRIPVDKLTCRPCTIFGKGECKRGDFACMNWLTPEIVFEKINEAGMFSNAL
jgi:ADP-heptose:LPS heptosyltransferase